MQTHLPFLLFNLFARVPKMLLSLMFALPGGDSLISGASVYSMERVALNYTAALNCGHKLRRAHPSQYRQLDHVPLASLHAATARALGMRMRCAA